MAKIYRKTGNVEPFASGSAVGERGTFGDPTGAAGATLDENVTAKYLGRGWYDVANPNTGAKPKIQDFQALGFTLSQFIAYLHQVGVPEYDAAQEYFNGSITNVGGVLYKSTVDNNIGVNPVGDATGSWENANKLRYDVILQPGFYTSGNYVYPAGRTESDYEKIEMISARSGVQQFYSSTAIYGSTFDGTTWRLSAESGFSDQGVITRNGGTGFTVSALGVGGVGTVVGILK